MTIKQKAIHTASKMYGLSISRSSELVESAYSKFYNDFPRNKDVREEDLLLIVGKMVLPCVS